MNQVYTNPVYLKNTWQSWKSLLSAGILSSHVTPKTLTEFKDLIQSFRWSDDIVLLNTILSRRDFSLKDQLCYLRALLTESHASCEVLFGRGEYDENDKLHGELELYVRNPKEGRQEPLSEGATLYGRAEAYPLIVHSETTDLITHRTKDFSNLDENIHNAFYVDRCLETLLIPVIDLLARILEYHPDWVYAGTDPGQRELLAKYIETIGEDPNNKNDVLDQIAEGRSYKEVFNATHQILVLRLVNLLTLCGFCDDREGAFDWLCSIDGPVFCGFGAAELTTQLSALYENHDAFPNFLEGVTSRSAAES